MGVADELQELSESTPAFILGGYEEDDCGGVSTPGLGQGVGPSGDKWSEDHARNVGRGRSERSERSPPQLPPYSPRIKMGNRQVPIKKAGNCRLPVISVL